MDPRIFFQQVNINFVHGLSGSSLVDDALGNFVSSTGRLSVHAGSSALMFENNLSRAGPIPGAAPMAGYVGLGLPLVDG